MRIFFLLLLILLSPFVIWADKPIITNFYPYTYQAANKSWAIAQDGSGIMYFGNDKGLLEFDGIRWEIYTIPDVETIRSVAISSDNLIFTGGFEEFGFWKKDISGKLQYTSLSKDIKRNGDLKNDDIWKIQLTEDCVYFQSFGHVFMYDYDTVKVCIEGINLLFLVNVYDEFWVQMIGEKLCKLEKGILTEIPGSGIFAHTEVKVVLPYTDGQYLIATSTQGFYIYDGNTFQVWAPDYADIGKRYQINSGIVRSNGNYFFGTILNGIYEFTPDGQLVNNFSTSNFLQNNTVLGLYEDDSGNIWAALDRGISYIRYLEGLDCYIDPHGQIGAIYSAAFFDDKLFLGTNQGLFYLQQSQLGKSESLSDLHFVEGTQGQVWDVKVYGDKLLCGHNYGLKIIDKHFNITTSDQTNSGVYKVTPVRYKENDLLFVSTYFVPSVLTSNLKLLYNFKEIREPIMNIDVDHLGNVWLTHIQKGLYRCRFLDGIKQMKYIRMYGGDRDEIENDGYPCLFRSFKLGGRLIFLGDDHFYVYNDIGDKIVDFEVFNQCFKNVSSMRNVIPLSENLFYVLTSNSVYLASYDGEKALIKDRIDITHNNLSLVNKCENAVVLNDSLSLICLDNGFLLHSFTQTRKKNIIEIGRPYIRSVKTTDAKGHQLYWPVDTTGIKVPYSMNNLSFDFYSKNVLAGDLSFQYQLKGVLDEWSSSAKIHEVLFDRLPEGNYTFLLRAVDNLDNHSESLRFSFRILPPWYTSVWAYVSYVLFFILIMIGGWFILLRRYRNIHLLKVRMREEQRLRKQNQTLQQMIVKKDEELFSQTSFIIQKNELILKVKKRD